MRARWVRWVLLVLVVAFAAAQAWRPERTNPPVNAEYALKAQYEVPQEVERILERACGDCHSNRTRWPWYSHVAPVSWMLADHVKDGRRHFNMDDFTEEMSIKDICQEIRVGSMPLKSYLLLHPEAKLSGAEIQAVCAWTREARAR
ncbi:MAG: heme-binding domain-containing protein [Bryobacteraceae bacterium]|nr:heme-binding domain-containing protein [Bryobacteraceae bacterium]MCX7604669.1 heme-binding domain-containing protein [Bryobacteraceae bacterium]